MRRIVVAGAHGLLGSSLVPYLKAANLNVISIGRNAKSDLIADLKDQVCVLNSLSEAAPDVVINLAALTNVDECEANPRLAFETNALVVRHLSHWVKQRNGKSHLIQISTDQLYDGEGPHTEEQICPINLYAYSKFSGELFAAQCGATILRTNFFGSSRCRSRRTLSDWLVDILRGRQTATVFSDILFSPLTLGTLSKFVTAAAARPISGTYNVGSREGLSKADFAFQVAGALGLSASTLIRGTAPTAGLIAQRPKDMRMDSSRFEHAFNQVVPTLQSEIELMRGEYAQTAPR